MKTVLYRGTKGNKNIDQAVPPPPPPPSQNINFLLMVSRRFSNLPLLLKIHYRLGISSTLVCLFISKGRIFHHGSVNNSHMVFLSYVMSDVLPELLQKTVTVSLQNV